MTRGLELALSGLSGSRRLLCGDDPSQNNYDDPLKGKQKEMNQEFQEFRF